jgi:hypothetical protein
MRKEGYQIRRPASRPSVANVIFRQPGTDADSPTGVWAALAKPVPAP